MCRYESMYAFKVCLIFKFKCRIEIYPILCVRQRGLPVDIYREEIILLCKANRKYLLTLQVSIIPPFVFVEQTAISRKWHRLGKEAFKSRGCLLYLRMVDAHQAL